MNTHATAISSSLFFMNTPIVSLCLTSVLGRPIADSSLLASTAASTFGYSTCAVSTVCA
jgi:hypothetical protein